MHGETWLGFKGRWSMATSSGTVIPWCGDSEQVTICSSFFSITGRFNGTAHISLSVQPQRGCSPAISPLPHNPLCCRTGSHPVNSRHQRHLAPTTSCDIHKSWETGEA